MPLNEPAWWYHAGAGPSLRMGILRGLATLYGGVARRRYQQAKGYSSRLPVICVGNFTVGGTGKTPVTAHICERLIAMGHKPAVLTRGYGGTLKGPHWLDPERDTAEMVGDEPLLHASLTATMISRDRAAGAKEIERQGESTVIVMDDGLLNTTLQKSFTIAVLDGTRGVGNGEVIPAGPLRAPLEFQLGLVDCIIVNKGAGEPTGEAARLAEDLRRHFPGPVIEAIVAPRDDASWLKGANVFAYAGIGHPSRFFDLLRAQGANLRGTRVFPDHHVFADGDAKSLMQEAERLGASLVSTEKDLVRLKSRRGVSEALAAQTRPLAIRIQFDPRDTVRFDALIAAAVVRDEAAPG